MSEKIMRKARVHYNGQLAGYLSETQDGFQFVYDSDYLRTGEPISISLPLRQEPFESRELFNSFRGLLPEGWYLDIVSKTAKVDANDSFGLLLVTAGDTTGSVTVHQVE